MTTTELRQRAQRAREAANESRATALARLEDATRRLRRAQELRALSAAALGLAAAEPSSPAEAATEAGAASDGRAPEGSAAARGDVAGGVEQAAPAAHEIAGTTGDEGLLGFDATPQVRMFVSAHGGTYCVRFTPYEGNPAERMAREEMRAIVFETPEGRWVGSVPVHPSCTLDSLSDRDLAAFLAFAR